MKLTLNPSPVVKATTIVALVSVLGNALTGCVNYNDRHPTAAEGKAADAKRQSYIDSLNISAADKAAMKSHMGGPPAPAGPRSSKPGPP